MILFFMATTGYCQQNSSVQALDKKLPNLDCDVLYANGSFSSYSVIHQQDKLSLDLNKLDELKDRISLVPKDARSGIPYIPLITPLKIEKITKNETIKLIQIKLVSKYEPGNRELIFDILNAESSYRMYILDNIDGFTSSLASLNCKELEK